MKITNTDKKLCLGCPDRKWKLKEPEFEFKPRLKSESASRVRTSLLSETMAEKRDTKNLSLF